MVEEYETLTPFYLVNVTPVNTSTLKILTEIVINHNEDYHKILNFTSRIKQLYNTVNRNIRTTYGRFIPNWNTHAQFNNINYSGKKRMLQYIQFVNDKSLKFSKIVDILEQYNDYNNKRNELRQQNLVSTCYGNFNYSYNSDKQIEYFVNHYNPYPNGIDL